jgi:neurofibromin 1
MNLLNDCSEEATEEKCSDGVRKRTSSNLSALRNCTVLAMSNLLNANIDSGLQHSIGNPDLAPSDLLLSTNVLCPC